MDTVLQHSIGSYGSLRTLSAMAALTAGGAGNNVQVTGITLDRAGFANGSLANTAVLGLIYTASITAGKALTLAYTINSSPDGSTWTALTSAAAATVATASGSGQLTIPLDLTNAGRFIQVLFTPDLTATTTDTAEVAAVGFFAGFDRLPAAA